MFSTAANSTGLKPWLYTIGVTAFLFGSPGLSAQDCVSVFSEQGDGSDREAPRCVSQAGEAMSLQLTAFTATLAERISRMRRQQACSSGAGVACGALRGGGASADETGSMLTESGRLSLLALTDYSESQRDNTALGEGFDLTLNSVTLGVDYRLGSNGFIGASLSGLEGDTDLDDNAGGQDSSSWVLSAHASRYWDAVFIDGLISVGRSDLDLQRRDFISSYGADADADYFSADLSVGYGYNAGRWRISPIARLLVLRGELDAYRESAGDSFGVLQARDKQDLESTLFTLSIQADYMVPQSWGVLIPSAKLDLQSEQADASRVRGQEISAFDGTVLNSIDEKSDDPDASTALLGLGVSAQFKRGWSAYFNSELLLGHEYLDRYSLVLGLRYEVP